MPTAKTPRNAEKVEWVAANRAMIAPPPAAGFRLVRYFSLTGLAAFLLGAAAMLYFERLEDDFFKQLQQDQVLFFTQLQDSFAKEHDAAARGDLLRIHEAGNVALTRLFANALWEKDFAPFVAKVQRIPLDHCRAINDGKDANGKTVQPREKKACYAEVGKKIVAFAEFHALDAKVFDTMKKSTVFKIKVFDLRGITVYSSEHNQIGEDKSINAGWESAVAGKPASELTRRGKFSAFEGVVENRDLISSYLPVLAPGGEKIVGVFEIYSDATPFLEQIKNTSTKIKKLRTENRAKMEQAAAANQNKVEEGESLLFAAVFGLGALLYLALFLVVRNAQRIIDKEKVERTRAQEALSASASRYRAVAETATDAIITADGAGTIVDWSRAAERMFGYSEAEVIGQPLTLLMPHRYRDAHLSGIKRIQAGGERRVIGKSVELYGLTKAGSEFPLELSLSEWETPEGRFFAGIIRDITERKRAELALMRQKDLYDMLSQTNQAIVRVTSREELFPTVCRVAVEHGRFRFAWVGLIGKEDQRVKPVAKYGEDNGYLDQLYISADQSDAAGRGATGQALRAGKHAVSNDFLNDPATAPWHEAARRAGVRASAAFPIREGGAVVGAINLYAGEPGFFTEEMLPTLEEIAIDLSYALDNFASEAARKQAEALLARNEQRLRSILQTSMDSFWIVDAGGRFLEVNDAYCRLIGYQREELLKMRIQDVEAMESPEDTARHIQEVTLKGNDRFETRHRRRDGQLLDVEVSVNFMSERQGEHFFVFMRDITERKRAEEALRAAEDQFRGLVEQSIAGIYIVQDGKFAYVNPRFAEILGYGSGNELIGQDNLAVVAEIDRGTVAENIRRRLEGEVQSVSYNFTAVRKDGSTIDAGVHGSLATYRGRPAIIGLMQDISEKKRAEEQIKGYVAQLENTFMQAVIIATTLGEMRDPYTADHERRVGEIAAAIGVELGFDPRRVEGLRVTGYLHDIGKVAIPAEILARPGKLTPTEFLLVKEHARASYDLLKGVAFPWPVAEVALQHHERLDGSGYPQGLKGEAILLEARILAVADTIEAMSSHRPYRPGLGIDAALSEIERGRGAAYDPVVVDTCLRLFREKGYTIPDDIAR